MQRSPPGGACSSSSAAPRMERDCRDGRIRLVDPLPVDIPGEATPLSTGTPVHLIREPLPALQQAGIVRTSRGHRQTR